MRLKSVELAGFKSFPDKTVLTFDAGLTAVLGPNGCGKSNIIDAIKWVLGEKSAKNLRGEEMLDVIFSGCATRAQSNMAQVKLTFDNSDQRLALPYNEVCVERRLYRSKESVYFINGNRCRLKDIRDLFLDTGVGSSAYSVIEQGRVEALLHAKPADRRAVFEEAAGIAKFKVKRKEILSRLDRSEQILLRVNDRVEEKEKQIRKVAAQAANARRHRKLTEERDAVRTRLYTRQFAAQAALVRDLAKQREALESDRDRADQDLAALNAEFTRLSDSEGELARRRDSVLEAASLSQEELAGVQLEQANSRNRIDSLAAEISRGNERRQELAARAEKLAAQEAAAREELDGAQRVAEELEKAFSAQDADRQSLLRDDAEAGAAVTDLRGRILDANRRRQELAADAARLETSEENAARRLEEADARLLRLMEEEEAAARNVAALESEYGAAAAAFGTGSDRLASVRENMRNLRQSADALLREERACESDRAAKIARKATLEDLENSFAGAFEGVKNILTAAQEKGGSQDLRGVVGMAVDLMSVPQDLAVAVETILGAQAQDVVVETARDAQNAIEYLKRNRLGRATFLPLDRIQPRRRLVNSFRNVPGVIGEAVDLVRFDSRDRAVMEYLLAGILVVDSLGLARDLAGREARGIKIVTLDGDVVSPSGAMTGGHGKQARAGLVQRKAELDAVAEDVAECGRRLEACAKRRAEAEAALERLAAEARELEQALAEAGRAEAGLKQNVAGRKAEAERLLRERAAAEEERAALLGGGRREELQALRESLAACEGDLAALETDITEKTAVQHAARERIDALGQDVARLAGERSEAFALVRGLEARIAEFAAEAAACREELGRPGMTNEEAEAETAACRARLDQLNAREEELLKTRDERRSTAAEIADSLSVCRNAIEALRQRERESQTQAQRLREGLALVGRQETECAMRMEGIRGKAREELQLDEADLLPPEAPEEGVIGVGEDGGMAAPAAAAPEPSQDLPEWHDLPDGELQKRIDDLSSKLRNIGSVNPEAIDELAELEAGAEFLRSHKEEMEEATGGMRAAVDRLNAESSARFTETFNTVRTGFQQMFSRLFRGGKADLFLEEVTEPGADPLDAGIDIHAQPPGKEPKNISLLSGGEKALCAVALLFALFRHKPSPFCILDEVDGPLDESNIDLFMNQVRDFSDGTQFIIITHSQRTMSMMDTIWGVTQQDAGISRVTSLSFSRMDALSRSEKPPVETQRLEIATSA